MRPDASTLRCTFDEIPAVHTFARALNDPVTAESVARGATKVPPRELRMSNDARESDAPLAGTYYSVREIAERPVQEGQHHWRTGVCLGPTKWPLCNIDRSPSFRVGPRLRFLTHGVPGIKCHPKTAYASTCCMPKSNVFGLVGLDRKATRRMRMDGRRVANLMGGFEQPQNLTGEAPVQSGQRTIG